jgi:hypothetical protein
MKALQSFALFLIFMGCAVPEKESRDPDKTAVVQAVRFLEKEVPAWPRDNRCFSCHNNGDGARALYEAKRKGIRVSDGALNDTSSWLERPDKWEHNKGDPGFSDQRLANLQFAATLFTSSKSQTFALISAIKKIAADQMPDGAWHIDEESRVGSPTTYGPNLATFIAWQLLDKSNEPEARKAADKAKRWLAQAPAQNIPAAAVFLLTFGNEGSAADKTKSCLELIENGQGRDGGWGPYVDAPPEVFDSALVLLALSELKRPGFQERIARGRDFLIRSQEPDGSWPATTRPSGGTSYAQKISTTAWATQALLKTAPR